MRPVRSQLTTGSCLQFLEATFCSWHVNLSILVIHHITICYSKSTGYERERETSSKVNSKILVYDHIHTITHISSPLPYSDGSKQVTVSPTLKEKRLYKDVYIRRQESLRTIPYHGNLSIPSCKGLLLHSPFTGQMFIECFLHGRHLGYSSKAGSREGVMLTMSSRGCHLEDVGFYSEKEEVTLELGPQQQEVVTELKFGCSPLKSQ